MEQMGSWTEGGVGWGWGVRGGGLHGVPAALGENVSVYILQSRELAFGLIEIVFFFGYGRIL